MSFQKKEKISVFIAQMNCEDRSFFYNDQIPLGKSAKVQINRKCNYGENEAKLLS